MGNSCKYYIKNANGEDLEFKSYDAMLDHIVTYKDLYKQGANKDIVFDNSRRDITQQKIYKIKQESFKYTVEHNSNVFESNGDIDNYLVKDAKNCIGTTKYLMGLKDIDGHYLFPEFIEKNYWKERKKDWDNSIYTPEELEILGTEINGEFKITNDNLSDEEKIALIKEKWAYQAQVGIEIHKAMEIFFRYDRTSKNVTLFTIPDNEAVLKIVKKAYDFKYLSDDKIISLIEHGRSIVKHFGGPSANVNYYPEFKVTSLTEYRNEDGEQLRLVGVIDLLILDASGNVHIIDYKTSPVNYGEYNTAKELTFDYQLATYAKMLSLLGLTTEDTRIYISPIKVNNLKKQNGKWSFENIYTTKRLVDKTDVLIRENIQNNINRFLPDAPIIDSTPEKLSETINNALEIIAPGSYYKNIEDDELEALVEENAEYNSESNNWSAKIHGISILGNSKEDLIKKYREAFNAEPKKRNSLTQNIQNRIKDALNKINNPDSISEPFEFDTAYGDANWIYNYLSKYFNKNWKVIETNEITTYHGMIVLKNESSGQVDILMISPKALQLDLKLAKGSLITGELQEDIEEKSKLDSLAFEGDFGNLELMKAMVMANQMAGLFNGGMIGNVNVINPIYGKARTASNELLYYNWKILNKLKPLVEINNINGKTIKMADAWSLAKNSFLEILKDTELTGRGWSKLDYETIHSKFDAAEADVILKRPLLIDLKEKLENSFKYLKTNFNLNVDYNEHPEALLYAQIQLAIAETADIKMNLVCKDGRLWLEDVNILKKGLGGLLLDNPGNLKNLNLNMITKLVMQVYQNVRDSLSRFTPTLDKKVNALKEAKGYTTLKERTIGNPTTLYINMITQDGLGNIILKNPWDLNNDLTSDEREFLEYFLIEINKSRNPKSINKLDLIKNDSANKFFWLPLAKGDIKSSAAKKGLLGCLKDKLEGLHWKNIKNTVRDEFQGFIEDEQQSNNKAEYLFEMNTMFDGGEGKDRMRIINDRTKNGVGISYFELNLETLLLKHKFGYITKEYMNEVFPDILAISTNIKLQSFAANEDFEAMDTYVQDFIKSKILKKNIDNERFDVAKAYSKYIMKYASYLALAFNPAQLYQFVEGIWLDVSLFIRRSDGSMKFTFSNLRDSFLSVLPEMVDFKNKKSKWEYLNEVYALNDMGIDEYVDRIKSDKHGFWGFFTRTAFKFASRPDFYNRCTIFGAQMRGDGCWDAIVEDEDGNWTYDWTLDSRFNLVATNNKSDLEKYNQQKALYIAIAKLLEIEHTRNSDGTLFKLLWNENGIPTALPKAYATIESESHKDVSDSIYGYYAEEKKSMILAYGLGALIMQMNTYWSAKKNLYLAPGGSKLQGKMEIIEGYYVDDEGNITTDPTSGVPLMLWRGDFNEGIILTAFTAGAAFFTTEGTIIDKWNALIDLTWNIENEKLRRAYRNNINLLWYDILMTFFMGKLIAGGIKESTKKYTSKNKNAFENLTLDYTSNIFFKSFTTFDAFSSIVSNRGLNWTPFSLSTINRIIEDFSEIVNGDKKLATGIINSSGLTKTFKPVLKEILYD